VGSVNDSRFETTGAFFLLALGTRAHLGKTPCRRPCLPPTSSTTVCSIANVPEKRSETAREIRAGRSARQAATKERGSNYRHRVRAGN
jgi:hypothetical protein